MMAWTFMSVYFVMALLLSLGGAIFVFMIAFNKRLAPEVLLFYVVATAGALGYFISSRDLNTVNNLLDPGETWTARLGNLAALGLCLVALVQICTRGAVSRSGVLVALAALQYYFVCFLLPVAYDRWFVWDHRLLYPVAALFIIAMPTRLDSRTLAINFARAVTVVSALSILLMAYKYNAAVLEGYDSILPFFKGRLYGATPHPNVLGPMSAFALLLLAAFPPRRRSELVLILAINVATLLLSQSKTSWITLIVSQAILHLPRVKSMRWRVPAWIYVAGFLAATAVPVALSLANHSVYNSLSGNTSTQSLSTLTGRTDIWQATFLLIKQHSLLLGPGNATYVAYMQSLFPTLVPNPHNLYLATIVQAGLIGLATLVVYIAVLTGVAASLRDREQLFGFAYLAIIIVRGMSEAFSFQSAFTAPNFWALLMFMRLLAVMSAEKRSVSQDAQPTAFRLRAA